MSKTTGPLPDFPTQAPGQAATDSTPCTVLWLIRHAEVEPRYHGVFGGTIDMDLSPAGQEQAAALANYLAEAALDALYVSPMRRAQQTIAPLLKRIKHQPVVVPEFREVDFGAWTGLTFAEVLSNYGFTAEQWLERLDCAGIPNAECASTLDARINPCLEQIARRHPCQQVAVVCHGGVIRVILAKLLRLSLSRMSAFRVDYASVTRIALKPLEPELQLLNFVPWQSSSG